GTDLPGFPGGLHPWGRQLQSHPPIRSLVPGGGLSKDRTTWRPSSAHFFVPVTALSPISRALFTEDLRHAGLLEQSAPQAWTIPGKPTRIVPPQPLVALCPTCGAPRRVVMRRWTSNRAFVDTSCKGRLGQATRGATRLVPCHGTRASSSRHEAATDA